jgi:hypothetical protein
MLAFVGHCKDLAFYLFIFFMVLGIEPRVLLMHVGQVLYN